jgi:hypothetical protein
MGRLGSWAALLFTLGATALGVAPLAASERGLAVGEKAPPFELVDQRGETRRLFELLALRPTLAVLFFRSADW